MEIVALIFKILSIISLTMLKFAFGPTLGYAAGFPMWLTMIITVVGMMSSVVLFTFLGDFIRDRIFAKFFKKQPVFSKKRRFMVTIWKKYGVYGVALLTPAVFTPIPGTLILVSFRTPVAQIMQSMLISAVLWSLVVNYVLYELGAEYFNILNKHFFTNGLTR